VRLGVRPALDGYKWSMDSRSATRTHAGPGAMVAMPSNHSLQDDPRLSVTGDDDGSVLLMAVRGSLDRTLLLRARTLVHKSLADYPAGLIVDLTELDDPAGASAPLWLTARQTGEAMQPPGRLPLRLSPRPGCGGPPGGRGGRCSRRCGCCCA